MTTVEKNCHFTAEVFKSNVYLAQCLKEESQSKQLSSQQFLKPSDKVSLTKLPSVRNQSDEQILKPIVRRSFPASNIASKFKQKDLKTSEKEGR